MIHPNHIPRHAPLHPEASSLEKVELPASENENSNDPLSYNNLYPALKMYGNKVDDFQHVLKVLAKNTKIVLAIILKALGSKNKFTRQIGLFFVYFLFMAISQNFIFSLIFGAFIGLIILAMVLYAKRVLKKYKHDLVEAMFIDLGIMVKLYSNDHIAKEYFNNTRLHKKSFLLAGEDLVEGTTEDFHFKFSELKAQSYPSWFGLQELFNGLYLNGFWDEIVGGKDFRIRKRDLLDNANTSQMRPFEKQFEFKLLNGSRINFSSTKGLIPPHIESKLIAFNQKHDVDFELIKRGNEVFLFFHGARDYFPVKFWDKLEGKEPYQAIAKDVFLLADFIHILNDYSQKK